MLLKPFYHIYLKEFPSKKKCDSVLILNNNSTIKEIHFIYEENIFVMKMFHNFFSLKVRPNNKTHSKKTKGGGKKGKICSKVILNLK